MKKATRKIHILIASISSLAVIASFFAEFVLDRAPCFLCLVQRFLYIALAVSAWTCLFIPLQALRKGCVIFIALNLFVSSYHTLVQFKLLDDRCGRVPMAKDVLGYKKMLLEKSRPGCSDDSSKIGVIPIPLFNVLASVSFLCFIKKK